MLSAMYGVSAMIPMTFGVAGYALVSRNGEIQNPNVTPHRVIATELTIWRAINADTLND